MKFLVIKEVSQEFSLKFVELTSTNIAIFEFT